MNLVDIAHRIYSRSLTDDYQPTTREMQESYDLTDDQMHKVKVATRKRAAEYGVLWDYYPPTNRYRVASSGPIAKVMLDYRLKHWRDAGNSVDYDYIAANKQGYATDEQRASVAALNREFSQRIQRQELTVAA